MSPSASSTYESLADLASRESSTYDFSSIMHVPGTVASPVAMRLAGVSALRGSRPSVLASKALRDVDEGPGSCSRESSAFDLPSMTREPTSLNDLSANGELAQALQCPRSPWGALHTTTSEPNLVLSDTQSVRYSCSSPDLSAYLRASQASGLTASVSVAESVTAALPPAMTSLVEDAASGCDGEDLTLRQRRGRTADAQSPAAAL